jgi:LacI family transcriptional regulator
MNEGNINSSMNNVTLSDIAQKAGVSIATVSRVVNRDPSVTPDMQEKIQKIIKQLKYTLLSASK